MVFLHHMLVNISTSRCEDNVDNAAASQGLTWRSNWLGNRVTIKSLWLNSRLGSVKTLDKLFKPLCPCQCHHAVYFDTGHREAMQAATGKVTVGLAKHYILQWHSHIGAHGLQKTDDNLANTPSFKSKEDGITLG